MVRGVPYKGASIKHERAFATDVHVFLLAHSQRKKCSALTHCFQGLGWAFLENSRQAHQLNFTCYSYPQIFPLVPFIILANNLFSKIITDILLSLKAGFLATNQCPLPLFNIENILDRHKS